jgi:hypothetical protein
MPRSCTAQTALCRGLRPSANQKVTFKVCSSRCIFCDIWRLATLVATHVPFSCRYSVATLYVSQAQILEFQRIEKRIQAQFQTQRVQLAGIMSMCTFDDAINSQGFRKAYSKCYNAIQQLLCEEADLEDQYVRPSVSTATSRRPSCADSSQFYNYERRPSRVGMAMWCLGHVLVLRLRGISARWEHKLLNRQKSKVKNKLVSIFHLSKRRCFGW